MCDGNPDVDAIYRLLNSKIKNFKFIKDKKFFISKKLNIYAQLQKKLN